MADNNASKAKAMTKSSLYQKIAESTKLTRKQVGEVFDALAKLVTQELGKKGPRVFTLPGLLKLKVVSKPAVKGGKVVPNPFKPGETMVTKDRPARSVVKALPLKNLKDMVK